MPVYYPSRERKKVVHQANQISRVLRLFLQYNCFHWAFEINKKTERERKKNLTIQVDKKTAGFHRHTYTPNMFLYTVFISLSLSFSSRRLGSSSRCRRYINCSLHLTIKIAQRRVGTKETEKIIRERRRQGKQHTGPALLLSRVKL